MILTGTEVRLTGLYPSPGVPNFSFKMGVIFPLLQSVTISLDSMTSQMGWILAPFSNSCLWCPPFCLESLAGVPSCWAVCASSLCSQTKQCPTFREHPPHAPWTKVATAGPPEPPLMGLGVGAVLSGPGCASAAPPHFRKPPWVPQPSALLWGTPSFLSSFFAISAKGTKINIVMSQMTNIGLVFHILRS